MTRLIFRSCLNIDVSGEERINPNLKQIDDDIHETGSGISYRNSNQLVVQSRQCYYKVNNKPSDDEEMMITVGEIILSSELRAGIIL